VAVLRGQVRCNHSTQFTGLECVLPQVPGGLVLVVQIQIRVRGSAHGKQQLAAVVGYLDIADVSLISDDLLRNVHLERTGGSTIAKIQVAAYLEGDLFTEILLLEFTIVVDRNRLFDVGNRKIDNDRVRVLTRADLYALVGTVTRRNCD
jgi:hypothetical protein